MGHDEVRPTYGVTLSGRGWISGGRWTCVRGYVMMQDDMGLLTGAGTRRPGDLMSGTLAAGAYCD